MIKAFFLFIILALVLGVQIDAHVDGSYLAKKSYGTAGDPVMKEVVKQIAAYKAAKAEAYAIQKGEKTGDLRAAQQRCVDLALYSYVKAMYLCEMGRVAARSGNKAQAKLDYTAALAAANTALTVNTNEQRTQENSEKIGKTFKVIAEVALKRLQ